jgi:hypothetical protein
VDSLLWNETDLTQGKQIKIKGFPKDHKVHLFRVAVSTHRTDWIVTNDRTQDSTAATQQACGYRWKMDICQTQPTKMTGCPLRDFRWLWHDLRGIFKREYIIDVNLVPRDDDFLNQTLGDCLALFEGQLFQIITQQAAEGCRVFRHLLPVEGALVRLH